MSPYFPAYTPPKPYFCPGCEEWYIVVNPNVSCCVLHSLGTCCHYSEEKVDPPTRKKDA